MGGVAETTKHAGKTHLYVPLENVHQATLIEGISVVGVPSLQELYLHLKSERLLKT